MKIKSIVLLLNIMVGLMLFGQTKFSKIKSHVHTINTVDWRETNLNDFVFLKPILSKKKILVLAESDHGHGTSLDAQAAILRWLIDSEAVHSLYIESNWINCTRIMEVLKEKGESGIKESLKFMRSAELKYWTKIGFWEFLAKKIIDGKLILRGFDIDGLAPAIAKELFQEAVKLKSVSEYYNSNLSELNSVKWYFDFFEGLNLFSVLPEVNYLEIQKFINKVIENYTHEKEHLKIQQWKSILNHFFWMYKRNYVLKENKYSNQIVTNKQFASFHSIRDSLMADIFLSNYLMDSNDVVVCSMASYHALLNGGVIDELEECCKVKSVSTLGEILNRRFSDVIYNICFIAASGNYGLYNFGQEAKQKIRRPIKGSMEYFLRKGKSEYCFLDLNSFSNSPVFYMNVIFDRYLKSNWKNNFPGVFFIRRMKPAIY
jgi:erythromycin esterase-like protein